MSSVSEQEEFLREDFYDALRWLFESAVAWQAITDDSGHWRHHKVIAMYTSLVQARALYEFFYKSPNGDDASVRHFTSGWRPPETTLYIKYMAKGTPAQKRVFHLVYNRSKHSGGPENEHEGPAHLKYQILNFALDLHQLTEEFVLHTVLPFQHIVETALMKALNEADAAAHFYGIANPFEP